MTTSLVTGAAGFIGSHVVHHLCERGHSVVALDDLSGGQLSNIVDDVLFVEGSVTDHHLIDDLFTYADIDNVFHLAAYAAEGLSHFIRRYNYTNNVIGSVNLINEAVKHGVQRFVFTSSIAVYGSNQLPMTEDMIPQPQDPYGIAKLAVELDLRAAHEVFGLDYTIFRPHNVYGEHQNIGDRYRNVIGIWMNQIMHGQPMTVFGDGSQTRAFSYIDDVAPVIACAPDFAASAGAVFNIGADRPRTVLELAHEVAHSLGVEPNIVHLPPRLEVEHAHASHDRLRSVFGLSVPPPTPLNVGLGRMGEWALTHGPRRTPEFTEVELLDGLPTHWL